MPPTDDRTTARHMDGVNGRRGMLASVIRYAAKLRGIACGQAP